MKIRLDFVSNSSSSSFMLVGQAFDYDDLMNAWLKLHPDKEAESDGYDSSELSEMISDELNLQSYRGIYNYYDMYAIGLPFDEMKDDETKKQFIDRIYDALSKAFGDDIKVEAIVDGGYDG